MVQRRQEERRMSVPEPAFSWPKVLLICWMLYLIVREIELLREAMGR